MIPLTVEEESVGSCGSGLAATTVEDDEPSSEEERRAASLGDTGDRRPGDISLWGRAWVSPGEATHLSDGVDDSCSVQVAGTAESTSIGIVSSENRRVRSSSLDEAKGGSWEMYSLNCSSESSAVRCPASRSRIIKRCWQFKANSSLETVPLSSMRSFCQRRVCHIPWASPS